MSINSALPTLPLPHRLDCGRAANQRAGGLRAGCFAVARWSRSARMTTAERDVSYGCSATNLSSSATSEIGIRRFTAVVGSGGCFGIIKQHTDSVVYATVSRLMRFRDFCSCVVNQCMYMMRASLAIDTYKSETARLSCVFSPATTRGAGFIGNGESRKGIQMSDTRVKVERKAWRGCEICGEPATHRVGFLWQNYRNNPKSSAYRRDDCSWCSDHDSYACEAHIKEVQGRAPDGMIDGTTWGLSTYKHMGECWEENKAEGKRLAAILDSGRELVAEPGFPSDSLCLFKDGDKWCAVNGDFINLQVSPAGFGDTWAEAAGELNVATRKAIEEAMT